MEQKEPGRRQVATTNSVFSIVETLQERNGAGVSEVAEAVDLAPSTVHKHLNTLVEREYVVKDGTEYRLGLRFLKHGRSVHNNSPLVPVAQDPIEQLAESVGEFVWVFAEEHGWGVHILKAEGEHGVQTHGKVGKRSHLHYLAAGKAMLAYMAEDRRNRILDRHGLSAKTEQTITDRDELEAEFETIRERGFAFNEEETVSGLRAVGAPIVDECVVGAVCICGPANRMRGERFREELPEKLLGTTNEIELKLSY